MKQKSRTASGARSRPHVTRPAQPPASARVGKRGTVVIPAELRRTLGMDEGAFIILERREDGVLIRPAEVVPVEVYSAERKAEFLLNGATSVQSYRWAVQEVRRMGLNPDQIPHLRPGQD